MSDRMPYRIDVHAHMLPPFYRQACLDHGHAKPDGMPGLPEWSPEAHLDLMNAHNIQRSILSISSPGTHLIANNATLSADLTRQSNEYASSLKRQHPDRFGFFASLPIPDVETCLREITLATRESCDGFIMMTNGHGVYPGSPILEPVFDELNRRKALLFIHPATPRCPCSPENTSTSEATGGGFAALPLGDAIPAPFIEFMFETARTVTNLFLSGTMQRYSDIQIILPHLGGALPPLLSRFTTYSGMLPGPWVAVEEDQVRREFERRVWFDLAGVPFPGQLKGFLEGMGVGHGRLLFGTDYPFTPSSAVSALTQRLDKGLGELFTEEQVEDMLHRNAKKMLGDPISEPKGVE